MSDLEVTPGEAEDTTTTADTSQETGTDQQQNWEERYKEAQSWGTRLAQEKAQLEQQAQLVAALQSEDPDARSQAMEALGLEVVDDTPDTDDTPYLTREEWQTYQQQQQQERAQTQQQAANDALVAQIEDHIETHPDLKGLDEDDRGWVIDRAMRLEPTMTPEGVPLPNIEAALQQFQGWETERQKKWATTKRTTHRVSPVGEAGAQVPDLNDREARQQWMEERFADLEANS